MFAIVRTGGKQYRVAAGDKIVVEKLAGAAGDSITLSDVLFAGDGGETKSTDGLTVSAEIIAQAKADKVTVFKKKRRHNYRRKRGHPNRDVTGHVNPPSQWVWSPQPTHRALITRLRGLAAERGLETITREGSLKSEVAGMQTRARLYELLDYESYNTFDTSVFNFQVPGTTKGAK